MDIESDITSQDLQDSSIGSKDVAHPLDVGIIPQDHENINENTDVSFDDYVCINISSNTSTQEQLPNEHVQQMDVDVESNHGSNTNIDINVPHFDEFTDIFENEPLFNTSNIDSLIDADEVSMEINIEQQDSENPASYSNTANIEWENGAHSISGSCSPETEPGVERPDKTTNKEDSSLDKPVTLRELRDHLYAFSERMKEDINQFFQGFQEFMNQNINEKIEHFLRSLFTDHDSSPADGHDRARKLKVHRLSLAHLSQMIHGTVVAIENHQARFISPFDTVTFRDNLSYGVISSVEWADKIEGGLPLREDEVLIVMIGEAPVRLCDVNEYNRLKQALNCTTIESTMYVYVDQNFCVRCGDEAAIVSLLELHSLKAILGTVCYIQEWRVNEDGNSIAYFQETEGIKVAINDGLERQLLMRYNMQQHAKHNRAISSILKYVQSLFAICFVLGLAIVLQYAYYPKVISNPRDQQMLQALLFLKNEVENGRPLHAFVYSISMAQKHTPAFKEYICRYDKPDPTDGRFYFWQSPYKASNETLLSYLVEQPYDVACTNVPDIICEKTFVEDVDWSFRLAFYMVHRITWNYLGEDFKHDFLDLPIEKRGINRPSCYNPLSFYNVSVIEEVKKRWNTLEHLEVNQLTVNDPNLHEMRNAMLDNLNFHIVEGFHKRGIK